MSEDRGTADLTLLIEQHKKDIWEWKQKESQWIMDKNQLDGHKRIVEELSSKIIELTKQGMAMKKRAEEAEGETTIVKGIGLNSPEMKALQARVEELDNSLAIALELNDSHQRYNGKLQTTLTEVEEDNKKLAKQVEDLENKRKFGEGKY
tara:strand:+ start:1616 stop:2065 length:450 start_codon:yes stop_codon:yes gene_type:complete